MRNDEYKSQGVVSRSGRANGLIPTSFRALSSYFRIVSSGASTVASSVRSAATAASAIVDRENDATHNQVYWAGFDKLECERDVIRRVILLGYRFGFQVWDVEEADNVHEIITRYDGPASFMQMLPHPIASKGSPGDNFVDSRPLLLICADGSFSGGGNVQDGLANGGIQNSNDQLNGGFVPTVVRLYSLKSQSYVHELKFRSIVYSVRCSPRVVAVLQAAQIHCFAAATLERVYTILTNPIVTSFPGSVSIGLGPLAVGPRWIAYSGAPVAVSHSGRVSPQHMTPSASFPGPASNGSVVAHYAKESSKQLAAGIVTLGDMGYKKLSRYYSELLPDGNGSMQSGTNGWKDRGFANGHLPEADTVGMVIVRDVVSKSVITQFRAHKSPISSLCFDPSGTLLVTASVQGHNINVFRITPGLSGSSHGSESSASYVQLYRLQRGFTNAVIQDISFSHDSHWIMISSSRGTNHLFAISPSGGTFNFQSADACFTKDSGSGDQQTHSLSTPITLSAISRIRSGNNGWRSTVTGAAAAATGRASSISGAIASAFINCSLKAKYHLLVFSPSGSVIQYALRVSSGLDSGTVLSGMRTDYESAPECDARLVVEAIQKWNICQKQNRREREDGIDIYGENRNSDSSKIFPEGVKKENSAYSESRVKVTKVKISSEERHHMYISEAELQMHPPRIPLWAKPEIYFQSMMKDDLKIDRGNDSGGELEIEKVPTYTLEARSKDLVPVVDYLQTTKFQPARVFALDNNNSEQLLNQRSKLPENGRLVCMAELHNGNGEIVLDDGLRLPIENTKGFVDNNDGPKLNASPEIVNNRESSVRETKSKSVNDNIGLKMNNHFDGGGEGGGV